MLISFKELQIGDEVVTPSYGNLNYLKLVSITKKGSHKFSRRVTEEKEHFVRNLEKEQNPEHHNTFIYIKDYQNGERDFFLVKRENYGKRQD